MFGAHLNDEQLAALDEARAFCLMVPPSFLDTPLDRSDRVESIAEWLEAHGGEIDQATALAETAMNVDGLEKLALVMKGETLIDALRWLASTAAINTIGVETNRFFGSIDVTGRAVIAVDLDRNFLADRTNANFVLAVRQNF